MVNRLYRNKEWMIQKYEVEGWSQTEISAFCDVSQGTVYKWMKKLGIESRDMTESHVGSRNGAWVDSPIKDYFWMYRKYVKEKKTLREIAKETKVGLRTVARWLKTHDIPARTGGDAIVADKSGENNPNWKGAAICPVCGRDKAYSASKCKYCHYDYLRSNPETNPNYKGVSDIVSSLRSYSKANWAPKILERDNYTCVECNKKENLHAHHIVPFALIKDQIIMENSDLDISIEDNRKKLLEIAKLDHRINDGYNGITLCEDCHVGEHQRIKTHGDDVLYTYYATVLEVLDPDTLRVEVDLGFEMTKSIEVRLYGINSPETDSSEELEKAVAIRGTNIVRELCPSGRRVVLRTYKPGKYGRWLALLFLNATNANQFLVDKNLAEEVYY